MDSVAIVFTFLVVGISIFFFLSPKAGAVLFYWRCLVSAAIAHAWSKLLQRIAGYSLLNQVSSNSWIHQIVKETIGDKIPSTVNVKITNDPLKGGFIGSMIKLALDWPQEASSNSQLPRSLVIKTVAQTFQNKFVSVILGNTREAYFYKHFHQYTKPNQKISILPRIYHASGNPLSGNFIIVMEDLTTKGILSSQLLGNQCWGPVQISKEVEQDPVIIINTIFSEIATIHKMFWRDQNLLSHSWLKNVDWIQGRSRHTWEHCMATMTQKWQKVKRGIENGTTTVKWSPKLIQTMEKAIQNTTWMKYRANFDIQSPNTPFTLCHGDFHAGNIMWSTNNTEPQIYLLDWSEVGVFCPFTELAQFLISNATIEVRRKNEMQFFKAYYEKLSVSASHFPLSDCWERYKAGGIEKWLQMLVLLACLCLDSNALPESAIQWFHDQVFAFIEDHADSCKRPVMFMTGYALP